MADNPRIEDLRRRIQKDPASIAFAQLAEEYRRAGQHQEAVDACRAGLVLHPGYPSARVTLGRALIELGDLERAQRELEAVLKSAPENLAAIRGMADIQYKRGALVEALDFYRRALALAPNDPDLEQTIADFAKRLDPSTRLEPKDGLSPFEAAQARSAEQVPQTPAPAPPLALRISSSDAADPTPVQPVQSMGAEGLSVRTIAALEQWLDAIHVIRAHPASRRSTSPHS